MAILPHGVSLGPLAQESLGTPGGFASADGGAAGVGSGREPAATLPP